MKNNEKAKQYKDLAKDKDKFQDNETICSPEFPAGCTDTDSLISNIFPSKNKN